MGPGRTSQRHNGLSCSQRASRNTADDSIRQKPRDCVYDTEEIILSNEPHTMSAVDHLTGAEFS